MQPRRRCKCTTIALAIVVTVSSCSSTEDSEPDEDMGGSGGAGPSGSGGSGNGGSGNAAGAGGNALAAGGGSGGMAGAGSEIPPSFASDVWPILTANCGNVSCHGDGSFLPQHAHSDVAVAYDEAQPVADLMAGRVSGQIMPIMPQFCGPAPGLGECLSVDEVQLIQAWAEAGAPY
jgi:hypothetical protein